MTEAETRAANWLEAWDAQGVHRTGTEGDRAGADWLAGEAATLGAEVTVEELLFERVDPIEAYLDIGGKRIEGVPVFDAPPTGADGVQGQLGQEIAVAELSPRAVYSGEFERRRRTPGHHALVVVCAGEAPGLAPINAEQFRSPYSAPAIHVSSEPRERVLDAAERKTPGLLVAHSRRTKAPAVNTVVTLKGRGPGRKPLVVMTPRSSWWQSTAERGGGIVCWLESLRALLGERPARDVVFTANTGHELGHLGLDDFVARRPGWDQPGGADWVHFGANLGAAGGVLSLVSNRPDLRALGLGELTRTGYPPDDIPWPAQPPSGETRDIHRAGGRYLTLVGTNRLFHLPQDRWPHAVDVSAVARIAAAAAQIALALSR
ncbi:MAG TPA: hypothetical protein VN808_05175 [Stellaceae bacterium]|nr:hypothetical protein [Patescibacteria group bacterium]HXP03490.1 hypothetical protein [Stellaceae bacterium]